MADLSNSVRRNASGIRGGLNCGPNANRTSSSAHHAEQPLKPSTSESIVRSAVALSSSTVESVSQVRESAVDAQSNSREATATKSTVPLIASSKPSGNDKRNAIHLLELSAFSALAVERCSKGIASSKATADRLANGRQSGHVDAREMRLSGLR